MLLVDQKYENNICEYIVHMYQTEDLLRVYDFNLDSIEKFVIYHLPIEEIEKKEFKNWYAQIKDEMTEEGIMQQGHLSRVQANVSELSVLHEKLLIDDEDYAEVFFEAEPHINHHISLSEGKIVNPIQICINGIYGLLLLRLNGKTVKKELQERLDHFGNVLSYLAVKYKE